MKDHQYNGRLEPEDILDGGIEVMEVGYEPPFPFFLPFWQTEKSQDACGLDLSIIYLCDDGQAESYPVMIAGLDEEGCLLFHHSDHGGAEPKDVSIYRNRFAVLSPALAAALVNDAMSAMAEELLETGANLARKLHYHPVGVSV